MKTRTTRMVLALLAALALVAAACGDDDGEVETGGGEGGGTSLTVGSTDFAEQQIVANMYALVLEDAGFEIDRRLNLGPREVVEPALEEGEIDLYPEYVGTALTFLTNGEAELSGDTQELTEKLRAEFGERGIAVLEPAPAQDKNALVVTPATAEEHGLETVSDLAGVAGQLVFGGPPECPERPLCLPGYEEVYGLGFADFKPLDAGGPVTKRALEGGDIDVALLFSSDGSIAAQGWIVLEDDKDLQPAENLVPVIREELLNDTIRERLNEMSARLTTAELSELNRRVAEEREDPEDVAEDWLRDQGLLGD